LTGIKRPAGGEPHSAAMPSTASPHPPGHDLAHALRALLIARDGAPVALLQTHLSWVLLTAERAYKLKKPVCLPFVDFSTPALRHHFCEEELRLNRRLSPALYLGVLPVRGSEAAPTLGAAGEEGDAIDHVVCMRRFAPGALLSEQVAAGRVDASRLDRLAHRLAAFHREAPVLAASSPLAAPEHMLQPLLDVLQQLEPTCGTARITALRSWAGEQMHSLRTVWLQRARDGHLRECHGDLHLANVAEVDGEYQAFDALEFDPALRWTDTMGDVGFLCMDLQAHGRPDLAAGFLDAYLQHSGDHAGLRVLRFQQVYRALVRALVATLSPQPAKGPDHLAWALAQVKSEGRAARLLITHGLSGAGKSTLTARLLRAAGAVRLRSDVERKRLLGASAGAAVLYSVQANERTRASLLQRARDGLLGGWPVIVDATFLRRADRQAFRDLARELDVPFTVLDCQADEAVLLQRIVARQAAGVDASDATPAVLQRQQAKREPLSGEERAAAIVVCTDQPVDIDALCCRWLDRRSV
jgi:aminoglycoside phosphotransferase family enzyme/predicted kinase